MRRVHPDASVADQEFQRILKGLVRFCQSLGCHAPEDAAQEAMLRTMQKFVDGTPMESIGAMATGVARFVVLEYRAVRESAGLEASKTEALPAISEVSAEKRIQISQALNLVQPDDRRLVREFYTYGGMETARRRGINRSALGVKVKRIIDGIRDALERVENAKPVTKAG